MTVKSERSCWCVARTALGVVVATIAVVYLFGGFDPVIVASIR
ncbi:hypothetical protein V5F77_08365 [Xanthobacter sp. DSM 24535]